MEQKLKQDINIGGNLRQLRKNAKLTQEQVAAKLQVEGSNVSYDMYAHMESSSYNIRISELAALCKIFKCSYNDFFAGI